MNHQGEPRYRWHQASILAQETDASGTEDPRPVSLGCTSCKPTANRVQVLQQTGVSIGNLTSTSCPAVACRQGTAWLQLPGQNQA